MKQRKPLHSVRMKSIRIVLFRSFCCALFAASLSVAAAQTLMTVRSIDFEGNHAFSANQLASALLMKKEGMFSEQLLRTDLERILDLYKSQSVPSCLCGFCEDEARHSQEGC